MVERNLAKVEVESSSLFSRSRIKGQSQKGCPFFFGCRQGFSGARPFTACTVHIPALPSARPRGSPSARAPPLSFPGPGLPREPGSSPQAPSVCPANPSVRPERPSVRPEPVEGAFVCGKAAPAPRYLRANRMNRASARPWGSAQLKAPRRQPHQSHPHREPRRGRNREAKRPG